MFLMSCSSTSSDLVRMITITIKTSILWSAKLDQYIATFLAEYYRGMLQ